MASSSASTSTADGNNCYQYDVFVNHRGPDVKKGFASHLYHTLTAHRLRVFLDIEEMQKGDGLTCQIEGAIRAASVHIAIFSPTYAESTWCLDELVLMLESMQENRSTIIPVFFGVEPSELRWTEGQGVYAEALRSLQNKKTYDSLQPRYDSSTIGKWKKALFDVAGISGLELEAYDWDERLLLHDVVEQVLKKVPKTPLNVSKYPTGLDDKVKDFETSVLLQTQQQSEKATVVGIVGLGGIGKTTLAKEFFNRHRTDYRRSCFLFDVRENHSRGSLQSLQSQLLKDLAQLNDVQINSIDEGVEQLRKHLRSCQALIILDDVEHIDQLDKLLSPAEDVLDSGSLILVTSRDKDVLINWGIGDLFIYTLQGLNAQHSMELFCNHAFHQPHALAGFETVVNEFLDSCGGLPLSLKVIGALLYDKDLEYWKKQLCKISRILPEDIQNRLKISYDSLDDEQKQIFLDIACFFIGEEKDTVISIWDKDGWDGSLGLQNLQSKCLIEVEVVEEGRMQRHRFSNSKYYDSVYCRSEKSTIRMHDHLRDLGRYLAEKEPSRRVLRELEIQFRRVRDCGNHGSGLHRFLTGQKLGRYLAEKIALRRLWRELEIKSLADRQVTERRLYKFLDGRVFSVGEKLRWLHWSDYPRSSLHSWPISMENLSVLQIEGSKLKTLWHPEKAPLELRELHISRSSALAKIPDYIGQLKHLEKIVLHVNLTLKTLPNEFCQLHSLKHLDLRMCPDMKSLPDSFGNLTNLQHIKLFKFRSLKTLPDSFGNLTELQHIELVWCDELHMLPSSFGNLIQLKFLFLAGCPQLTISKETLGQITTLEVLNLSKCRNIKVLPPQLTYQQFLREMRLKFLSVEELPTDIGNLSYLKILELDHCGLKMLPPSFGHIRSSLEELDLEERDCFLGVSFLGLWTQLKRLSIRSIRNLEQIEIEEYPSREPTFKNVGREIETSPDSRGQRVLGKLEAVCPSLQYLGIKWCGDLEEVGALPATLTELELHFCYTLRKIGGLCSVAKLQRLEIMSCSGLEELPGIETLVSLEELRLEGLKQVRRIQGLAQLTKLQILSVEGCSNLEEVSGVEHLRSLKRVYAANCPKLQWSEEVVERLGQRLERFSRHSSPFEESDIKLIIDFAPYPKKFPN